jgi:hypothetical protein
MNFFRFIILFLFALILSHCAPIPFNRGVKIIDRNYKETEARQLIDCPTANISPRRSIELYMRSFSNGGTLGGMTVGIWDDLMITGSFGGENILGEGPVSWYPSPGVGVRWQAIYGGSSSQPAYTPVISLPALSIGFDSQGYGAWFDDNKRYRIKSKGFYAVVSSNYSFLSSYQFGIGFHAGINYSLEYKDEDDDVNAFVGFSWTNNTQPERQTFGLHAEFDFGINDNGPHSLGAGKGYLNVGIKIAPAKELFSNRLFLEFDIRDILKNSRIPEDAPEGTKLYNNRILKLVFLGYF